MGWYQLFERQVPLPPFEIFSLNSLNLLATHSSLLSIIFGPYYRLQLYGCTLVPELSTDTRCVCSTDEAFSDDLYLSMLQVFWHPIHAIL
jgi:hypothetical protein